jgi:hypothetical protein
MLDERERAARRFVNVNARVADPVEELRQEALVRPWDAEERRVFMDKFLAFPKARAGLELVGSQGFLRVYGVRVWDRFLGVFFRV